MVGFLFLISFCLAWNPSHQSAFKNVSLLSLGLSFFVSTWVHRLPSPQILTHFLKWNCRNPMQFGFRLCWVCKRNSDVARTSCGDRVWDFMSNGLAHCFNLCKVKGWLGGWLNNVKLDLQKWRTEKALIQSFIPCLKPNILCRSRGCKCGIRVDQIFFKKGHLIDRIKRKKIKVLCAAFKRSWGIVVAIKWKAKKSDELERIWGENGKEILMDRIAPTRDVFFTNNTLNVILWVCPLLVLWLPFNGDEKTVEQRRNGAEIAMKTVHTPSLQDVLLPNQWRECNRARLCRLACRSHFRRRSRADAFRWQLVTRKALSSLASLQLTEHIMNQWGIDCGERWGNDFRVCWCPHIHDGEGN